METVIGKVREVREVPELKRKGKQVIKKYWWYVHQCYSSAYGVLEVDLGDKKKNLALKSALMRLDNQYRLYVKAFIRGDKLYIKRKPGIDLPMEYARIGLEYFNTLNVRGDDK